MVVGSLTVSVDDSKMLPIVVVIASNIDSEIVSVDDSSVVDAAVVEELGNDSPNKIMNTSFYCVFFYFTIHDLCKIQSKILYVPLHKATHSTSDLPLAKTHSSTQGPSVLTPLL